MTSKSAGPLRSLETAEQPHPGGWGDRKYKPVGRLHKHAPGTHGVQTISQHWMCRSGKAEVPAQTLVGPHRQDHIGLTWNHPV